MARPFSASAGPVGGTLFSTWQATTQAWHAVQRSKSITIAQRGMT
jgi:hypothetical protein